MAEHELPPRSQWVEENTVRINFERETPNELAVMAFLSAEPGAIWIGMTVTAYTPDEAREIAQALLAVADRAEQRARGALPA